MRTRRQILQHAICAPIALCARGSRGPQIFAAPDCLSQESAAGFRSVLGAHAPRNLIVLCGLVNPSPALDLRRYALNGGWILWEAPLRSSLNPFGIVMEPPIAASADHLYIRYRWPQTTLTRSFSSVVPVQCQEDEIIAHYRDIPVAMTRCFGRGRGIFLGSMLGPNLQADEPQSCQLLRSILEMT
jgi:hypothetical protein